MYHNNTVTIAIAGTEFMFSLSKTTTSDDIIKIAVKRAIIPNGNEQYGLFEKTSTGETLLPGNTKLQKLIQTMGVNTSHYQLEVRSKDKIQNKMASILARKSNLEKMRHSLEKYELKQSERHDTYLETSHTKNANKVFEKNIPTQHKVSVPSVKNKDLQISGKVEIMTRYLQHCESDFLCRQNSRMLFTERTRGDGCDETNLVLCDESTVTGSSGKDLDTAFISNSSVLENPSNKRDELNECVVYDDLDLSITDHESAFGDDSECGSVCELERNVFEESCDDSVVKSNKIKAIFSDCRLNSRHGDDSMLESFMNTFIHDEDSDEGLSSACSDFE